jgi:hypothetical protein
MTDRSKPMTERKAGAAAAKPVVQGAIMKTFLNIALALVVTSGIAVAKEMPKDLPNAPSADMTPEAAFVEAPLIVPAPAPRLAEKPTIDKKFVGLAIMSTGSTFADSYTTLFARQNWLAGKTNVCNMEAQSAYLYGTHPTVGRAYAVASVKSAASLLAAYYLRKHHNRFWSAPLIGNSVIGLMGVNQNMRACN